MAFAATLARRAAAKAGGAGKDTVLKKGARRDPELYILLGIMSGAFGLAGFYFGRKPTSATSEAEVSVAQSSMPWQVEHDHEDQSKHFKYQYHPKGDKNQTPKNAPSALNTVIVPNVTLPKAVHDAFNKWGKENY
ncbi:uncharacterized protein A1O5_08205 [Cladophialophora psammophila CBS 110553]|uniref:Uncharacterized protein n=1 Tax=Cladophialophora psammophila CBS 110553 TaxID=1182543 RepID=W9WKI6_9EURO|nr:uncharacterized protein A1O5_08205 [Cladophialophora psammophila CBS 110553]EXJ68413.1 hypothetical protein A1O5_08205 [Cladophialophora psammophila CBS 110553]